MNDQELENLVKSLKPSPLPGDLRDRLATEPSRTTSSPRSRMIFIALSIAAAAVVVFCGTILFHQPEAASDPLVEGKEQKRPVSVVQKDSTLLSSRLLSIEEYDGELWGVSEEEWRDDTLVLYSGGPSQLSSTVIRREVVCAPLEFQ